MEEKIRTRMYDAYVHILLIGLLCIYNCILLF